MTAINDLHMDDFYSDVAKILTRLYFSFPRPLSLYVDDICGALDIDEFGLISERHQACLATMLWLADEGYLRYAALLPNEGVDLATLTEKCLRRLQSTSTIDQVSLPRIIHFQRALSGTSFDLQKVAHEFFDIHTAH